MDMRDRILGGMRTGTGEDCIWTHVRKKAEELNDGSHISRCICNTVARREIKENISSRFVQSPSLTPPNYGSASIIPACAKRYSSKSRML